MCFFQSGKPFVPFFNKIKSPPPFYNEGNDDEDGNDEDDDGIIEHMTER